MSKLTKAELSTIIEAAESGAIGFVTSPFLQGLVAVAREQIREERGRAIQEMVREQEAEERDRYKVRCPQCGGRLVLLEEDYD